jgi:hypothetical protein
MTAFQHFSFQLFAFPKIRVHPRNPRSNIPVSVFSFSAFQPFSISAFAWVFPLSAFSISAFQFSRFPPSLAREVRSYFTGLPSDY